MGKRGKQRGPKRCPQCGEKDLSKFAIHRGRYDGLQPYCRSCSAQNHKARGDSIARHGITKERYDAQLKKQKGLCALCGKPPLGPGKYEKLIADHDHSCCPGVWGCEKCFRGLIHHKCNCILGWANDDVEILLGAIAYLKNNLTIPK